jgi:hypothetical protein
MATEESKARRKGRRRDRGKLTADWVQSAFVVCGRCSFFLAAYRVNHDDFEEATRQAEGNWLVLAGDKTSRQLLYKTFGCRFEVDTYHLEAICPECQRRYVYDRGLAEPAVNRSQPPAVKEPLPESETPSPEGEGTAPEATASLSIQITPA